MLSQDSPYAKTADGKEQSRQAVVLLTTMAILLPAENDFEVIIRTSQKIGEDKIRTSAKIKCSARLSIVSKSWGKLRKLIRSISLSLSSSGGVCFSHSGAQGKFDSAFIRGRQSLVTEADKYYADEVNSTFDLTKGSAPCTLVDFFCRSDPVDRFWLWTRTMRKASSTSTVSRLVFVALLTCLKAAPQCPPCAVVRCGGARGGLPGAGRGGALRRGARGGARR